jgi:hypothetical protein
LAGDKTGGGHRPGTGNPGKSEFPVGWSDSKILSAIEEIGRAGAVVGNARTPGGLVKSGTIDGVTINVVVDKHNQIVTGFPTDGVGVRFNQK